MAHAGRKYSQAFGERCAVSAEDGLAGAFSSALRTARLVEVIAARAAQFLSNRRKMS
jgi:hypothetical protein